MTPDTRTVKICCLYWRASLEIASHFPWLVMQNNGGWIAPNFYRGFLLQFLVVSMVHLMVERGVGMEAVWVTGEHDGRH